MKLQISLSAKQSWYHLSDGWKPESLIVKPRTNRVDDEDDPRDTKPFIAVCPSIAQCIIALGEWRDYGKVRVYEAVTDTAPDPATWVFDSHITDEHRFYEPIEFRYVGQTIDIQELIRTKILTVRNNAGISDAKILKNAKATLEELHRVFPK